MKGVKFNKGDKIFAKVRGYPPWPAKIEAVADETPSKMKYHVYFFGTAETAIVKAEDICLYGPNRNKLGKRKKHKNFAEAMEEIEASLTAEELSAFESLPDEKDEKLDESKTAEDDDNEKKKPKPSLKRKRKDETEPAKKPKTDDEHDESEIKEEPDEKKEILSRSGRKIKPKRYPDEDDEKDSKDFIVAKKDGQTIKIPLNLNKPKFAERYESEWSKMVLDHASSLKKMIENGEFKENPVSHMDEWTKAKSEEISLKENSESMRILDTEMDLLENVNALKKSLTLEEAKCEKAISAFESLERLSLTPLMLKKNPDTVYSIAKIVNYKGNLKEWKLSENELLVFNENAEKIRKKASHIYNKMMSLFLVGGQDFLAHFEKEVGEFNEKYAHLSPEEMVSLAKED